MMVLVYWGADKLWVLIAVGLILLLAAILGIQAHRMRVLGGNEELPGMSGEVTQASDARGYAYAMVRGEIWRVRSQARLATGDSIRVRAASGLTLKVEKIEDSLTSFEDGSPTNQGDGT